MLNAAVSAFSLGVALFSTWKLNKTKLELEAEKLARKRAHDRDSRWIYKLVETLTDEQWDEIKDFFGEDMVFIMSERDFYQGE